MTQTPSGWYPDPTPAQADHGPSLRWWDGAQWTEHVAQPPAAAYPAKPMAPNPAQPYPAQPYPGQPPPTYAYGAQPPPTYAYGASPYPAQPYAGSPEPTATTPDGQPLAGWWRRVGAAVIDGFIAFPIAVLIGLPFLIPMGKVFADEWDRLMNEIDSGAGSQAFGADFQSEVMWYAFGFGMVALLVGAVYEIGFLRWKRATPGKMMLGLEVRLRERPGTMPWGTLFQRWFVKKLGNILAQIPVVGSFLQFGWVINYLWPLWDDKKQALHDKAAGTNVVRTR